MSPWLIAWLVVLIVEVVGIVLSRKPSNKPRTLSEHVWWLRDRSRVGKLGLWPVRVILVSFCLWLGYHFGWGGD